MKTVRHAKEFPRLGQQELHSALNSLKSEYVATIRKLAEREKEKQFKTFRDAVRHRYPKNWLALPEREKIDDTTESWKERTTLWIKELWDTFLPRKSCGS